MKLIVDGPAGTVSAGEAEDLSKLSVELRDCSPGRASALLDGLGRVEGDHAWLRIDALREMAPAPRSCSWDERFGTAMAYAGQQGWTDPEGGFVRAHITVSGAGDGAGTPVRSRAGES
jgi:hypothetical protein